MIVYKLVNPNNLKQLYNNPDGNLYFRVPLCKKRLYDVCDGFSYQELYSAVCAGECELIWIQGPSLGTGVEV